MITTMPNSAFSNVNVNALISQYAAAGGYGKTDVIAQAFNTQIFDGAPANFPLLYFLNRFAAKKVNSDEHFFAEAGWQRNPITVGSNTTGVTYPALMTIPISSFDDVALDMQVSFPNGEQGLVKNINTGAGTIDVTARTNATLPSVLAGDTLSFTGTIEADAAEGFKQYFRMSHTTKWNYVQMMPFAIKWGKMEMMKYKESGQFDNFLSLQLSKFYEQSRVSLENVLWQGIRGEFKLSDGTPAKTMGGIDYFMTQAGSPTVTTPISTIDLALEQLAADCQFEPNGSRKMLFGTPRNILKLSKIYKSQLTRYAPNDEIAKLGLNEIDLGFVKIPLVGVQRWEDTASFPSSWAKRMYLTDLSSINLCYAIAPEAGVALNRSTGLPVNKEEMWINYTQSIEFFKPLASGKILIS